MLSINKSKKGGYETKKVELKGWWEGSGEQTPNKLQTATYNKHPVL